MDGETITTVQGRHLMQCWSKQQGYAPLAVKHAEGCWIHTYNGRKIFDLRSAHECINLGFNHPKVLAAMRAQMEKVVYVTDDFATEPTARLTEALSHLSPGGPDKKVFLCQSGAAAIEAAIKGARLYQYNRVLREGASVDAPEQYPYPYKIISRYRSWHGATSGAASASGDPRRWFQEPLAMPGIVFAPDANPYRSHFGEGSEGINRLLAYMEDQIEQEGGSNKVAAILIETIVGSNGIILPPKGYLEGIRALCDRWNLLLIVDETMTGMGRTGKLFAIEHYEVVPDIITMGKALGVYCPLGATLFSEKVARSFDDHVFGHGQSFSGHALACAGALASLEVLIEDGLMDRAAIIGKELGERLRVLADRHPCVGDVRGLGLFWTMELVQDRASKTPVRRATEKYAENVMGKVAKYLLEKRNVYVPSDKFGLWIVPPLVVEREEMEFLIDALDDGLTFADSLL